MGRTFKILVQHKNLEQPALDGLTFKPFFGSALSRMLQRKRPRCLMGDEAVPLNYLPILLVHRHYDRLRSIQLLAGRLVRPQPPVPRQS